MKEHNDLMTQFELQFKTKPAREQKQFWKSGNVYADGHINKEFVAFRKGYAFAKAIYQQ